MGRYAFFNTGMEYKFGFGIQPSSDIEEFGGTLCFPEEEFYNLQIQWSAEDIPLVLRALKNYAESLGLEEFSVDTYPKALEGTQELYCDLSDMLDMSDKESYTYRLGLVIYHQLLYTPILIAKFEC